MTTQIQNWTKAHALTVKSASAHSTVPALVMLTADGGGMYFQHSMTADQALQMADALTAAAARVSVMNAAAKEAA